MQYMEDDIHNYLSTVMFRGTPCTWSDKGCRFESSIAIFAIIRNNSPNLSNKQYINFAHFLIG